MDFETLMKKGEPSDKFIKYYFIPWPQSERILESYNDPYGYHHMYVSNGVFVEVDWLEKESKLKHGF